MAPSGRDEDKVTDRYEELRERERTSLRENTVQLYNNGVGPGVSTINQSVVCL